MFEISEKKDHKTKNDTYLLITTEYRKYEDLDNITNIIVTTRQAMEKKQNIKIIIRYDIPNFKRLCRYVNNELVIQARILKIKPTIKIVVTDEFSVWIKIHKYKNLF